MNLRAALVHTAVRRSAAAKRAHHQEQRPGELGPNRSPRCAPYRCVCGFRRTVVRPRFGTCAHSMQSPSVAAEAATAVLLQCCRCRCCRCRRCRCKRWRRHFRIDPCALATCSPSFVCAHVCLPPSRPCPSAFAHPLFADPFRRLWPPVPFPLPQAERRIGGRPGAGHNRTCPGTSEYPACRDHRCSHYHKIHERCRHACEQDERCHHASEQDRPFACRNIDITVTRYPRVLASRRHTAATVPPCRHAVTVLPPRRVVNVWSPSGRFRRSLGV